MDPDTFWPEAERNPGRSFLSASAVLEPGDVFLGAGAGAGSTAQDGGLPLVFLVGLLLFLALDVALVVYVDKRRRRSERTA